MFASCCAHLLYTQRGVLRDGVALERRTGHPRRAYLGRTGTSNRRLYRPRDKPGHAPRYQACQDDGPSCRIPLASGSRRATGEFTMLRGLCPTWLVTPILRAFRSLTERKMTTAPDVSRLELLLADIRDAFAKEG